MIDLRSDTVTKPCKSMIMAMMEAEVGDDVFGEDPTVNALENKGAQLFGKESGLYCSSGSQTNQVAIKAHTQPGDEVICDSTSHVYRYEGGGIAFNSGASVRLINGNRGRITATDVLDNINPDDLHYPITSLVSIENTSNKGGGSCYNIDELSKIKKVCSKNNLPLHLDGARFFNAITKTGETALEHGALFDSISICLSKGLGSPVGSLLLGSSDFIKKARRIRKVYGGGMRQAGFIAAAGIYALDNNISRLNEDHQRAKELKSILSAQNYVEEIIPVETNIIIFKLRENISNSDFLNKLESQGIKAISFGPRLIRFVTHLDFTDDMLTVTTNILKNKIF
ncbi:MAG: aminotransferase class I/II-fold pyridoxal phosphate-dependent enzyme [Bacteroidetes bacterium]|nr:aminotransferase class I/II-fold pyridoxal phosphate-dependent enzyme [Bacteroidota bacterium]